MCFSARSILLLFSVLLPAFDATKTQAEPPKPADVELSDYVISPATFGRKQLYTWTRPEQIAELRAGKALLTRSASAAGEPSRFDLILADKAYDALPLAVALRAPRFAKKRFAWPAAWPTIMGWENETYGDQLIQITLKDDAIIIAFTPFPQPTFQCRDALGKPVDEAVALAHPEKIAAVYFCAVRKGIRSEQTNSTMRPIRKESSICYREYVVCNEAMIAAWQYAGAEVKQELANEIAFLEKRKPNIRNPFGSPGFRPLWRPYNSPEIMGSIEEYRYAIAFPNDYYLETAAATGHIIETMKAALAAQKEPAISR